MPSGVWDPFDGMVEPRINCTLAIGDAEKPVIAPPCPSTVLADSVAGTVVVTHNRYAVAASQSTADMPIDAALIGKEVLIDAKTCAHRSLCREPLFDLRKLARNRFIPRDLHHAFSPV